MIRRHAGGELGQDVALPTLGHRRRGRAELRQFGRDLQRADRAARHEHPLAPVRRRARDSRRCDAPADPLKASRPATVGTAGVWNLPLATTTRSNRSVPPGWFTQPTRFVPARASSTRVPTGSVAGARTSRRSGSDIRASSGSTETPRSRSCSRSLKAVNTRLVLVCMVGHTPLRPASPPLSAECGLCSKSSARSPERQPPCRDQATRACPDHRDAPVIYGTVIECARRRAGTLVLHSAAAPTTV